jgi:hypothetical protein
MDAANTLDAGDDLSPLTGEFRQETVERRFRRDHIGETVAQARLLFALGAIAATVILTVSVLVGPESGLWLTAARIGVIGLSLAGYVLVTRVKWRLVEPLIICWQAAVVLSAALFASTQTSAALVAVFFVPALFYLAVPVSFRTAFATGSSSSALMLAAYASAGFDDQDIGIAVALLVTNIALWLVAVHTGRSRRTRALRERPRARAAGPRGVRRAKRPRARDHGLAAG